MKPTRRNPLPRRRLARELPFGLRMWRAARALPHEGDLRMAAIKAKLLAEALKLRRQEERDGEPSPFRSASPPPH